MRLFSNRSQMTDARQHGIYLFNKITKQATTGKAFLNSKSFNITLANMKKAISRNLLSIQNGAISLVPMRSQKM